MSTDQTSAGAAASTADAAETLRVVLKFPDVPTFTARFAAFLERGRILLPGAAARPIGAALKFQIVLKDGPSVIGGAGRVESIVAAGQIAGCPPGMVLQFEPDAASLPLVQQILGARGEGRSPTLPPPVELPPLPTAAPAVAEAATPPAAVAAPAVIEDAPAAAALPAPDAATAVAPTSEAVVVAAPTAASEVIPVTPATPATPPPTSPAVVAPTRSVSSPLGARSPLGGSKPLGASPLGAPKLDPLKPRAPGLPGLGSPLAGGRPLGGAPAVAPPPPAAAPPPSAPPLVEPSAAAIPVDANLDASAPPAQPATEPDAAADSSQTASLVEPPTAPSREPQVAEPDVVPAPQAIMSTSEAPQRATEPAAPAVSDAPPPSSEPQSPPVKPGLFGRSPMAPLVGKSPLLGGPRPIGAAAGGLLGKPLAPLRPPVVKPLSKPAPSTAADEGAYPSLPFSDADEQSATSAATIGDAAPAATAELDPGRSPSTVTPSVGAPRPPLPNLVKPLLSRPGLEKKHEGALGRPGLPPLRPPTPPGGTLLGAKPAGLRAPLSPRSAAAPGPSTEAAGELPRLDGDGSVQDVVEPDKETTGPALPIPPPEDAAAVMAGTTETSAPPATVEEAATTVDVPSFDVARDILGAASASPAPFGSAPSGIEASSEGDAAEEPSLFVAALMATSPQSVPVPRGPIATPPPFAAAPLAPRPPAVLPRPSVPAGGTSPVAALPTARAEPAGASVALAPVVDSEDGEPTMGDVSFREVLPSPLAEAPPSPWGPSAVASFPPGAPADPGDDSPEAAPVPGPVPPPAALQSGSGLLSLSGSRPMATAQMVRPQSVSTPTRSPSRGRVLLVSTCVLAIAAATGIVIGTLVP